MNSRTVAIGRGFDWITEGFGLFRASPWIWIINIILFSALSMLLSIVPFIGAIAAMILQPVLVGGLLLGCQAQEQGEPLQVDHLFAGFRQNTQELALVGVFSGVAYLAIGIVIALFVGGAVGLSALTEQQSLVMGTAMASFALSGLIGLALTVPVAMATWFAPAMVLFGNLKALDAMKASFAACWGNMLPFLLYGVVLLVLAFVAVIPFGLGLFVLAPTLVASVYTAYRDIFQG